MHQQTAMDLLSSRSLRQSQSPWSQALWAHNLWRSLCAGFRHSAGFHARVVLLDSDVFRPGLLGEVDDALGVLRVDRVVPTVVRVQVSW